MSSYHSVHYYEATSLVEKTASDTYTLEDSIDAAAVVVEAPIDKTASDTYTLEDAIDAAEFLVLIEASDTYTLESDVESALSISAIVASLETYTLESEIESVVLEAQVVASDTYTLESDIDGIGQVRSGGLRWHLFIDWQGDGTFIDEVQHLTFPVNIQRGGNDLNDKVGIGTAQITLDNYAGRFSPLNTSSPLYPWVTGGNIPFQFSYELYNEVHPIFTGYIQNIHQLPIYEEHLVSLQCVDVADVLSEEEIRDQLYEDEYTGNIFASIMQNYFPYIRYDELVLEDGAVGYWRLANEDDQLLIDQFESLASYDHGPITDLCFNFVGSAETGQPWQFHCEPIVADPNAVAHYAFYTKPYWQRSVTGPYSLENIGSGAELYVVNQTQSLPGGFTYLTDHHIFLIAETESRNVSLVVQLNQTPVNPSAETYEGVTRTSAFGALAVIRYTDLENCLYAQQTLAGYDLIKLEAGVRTVLDSVVVSPGLTDTIQVDAFNDDISVYINGVLSMQVTETFNNTATKHGIGRWLEMSARTFMFDHPTLSPDITIRFGSVTTYQKTSPDQSGNGNSGVYYGVPGEVFEDNKYVDVGDPALLDFTDDFVVEAWYRRDISGALPIVSKASAYGLKENGANIPYAFVFIGGIQYTTPTTGITPSDAGTSYYVVLRRVGTSLQLFRNGTLLSEATIPAGVVDTNGNPFLIGREGASYIEGAVFDVAVYDPASSDSEISSRYLSKTLFGLSRNISRGRQRLQIYAPSGNKIWDAGQELGYEELGGHAFVTKEGVVTFLDRWDLSREPIYLNLDNTGLIDAPIDVQSDDLYDRARAKWSEFNLFDEENQWVIWQSVVADGENHARMNKLLKPGSSATENTFSGEWEKSGIQISPGQIDPDTHIAFIVMTQPAVGLSPFDEVADVSIEQFVYDDIGYTITFNNESNEDRYLFNLEIKIAESAIIQKLPIDFIYQRDSNFIRKTGKTREDIYNWNTDTDAMVSSVIVRSKIGATIHPRPDGVLSDVSFEWLRAILDADICKRVYVREDNHAHSSKMNDEYIIKGIQLNITEDEVAGVWSLWDQTLAEAHYFIIGQSAIDSLRVITF